MGFDNECILNIQTLPGEYFCPVCRTLVYPTEALQTQCTHLYCKPCLAHTTATTQACPYDGYLVTQADSKPLIELNKPLADEIGKVLVHCLYYRSSCPWQGTFSECITHCSTCSYGNSPVLCNRCGAQIMHRQVQEHAQVCPVLPSQVSQPVDPAQPQTAAVANQYAEQNIYATPTATPAASASAAPIPTSAPGDSNQAAGDQWYQQQYHQQYPNYDPYAQYTQYTQQPQSQVAPFAVHPPQSQSVIPNPQMQIAAAAAAQNVPSQPPYLQSQPHMHMPPLQQPLTPPSRGAYAYAAPPHAHIQALGANVHLGLNHGTPPPPPQFQPSPSGSLKAAYTTDETYGNNKINQYKAVSNVGPAPSQNTASTTLPQRYHPYGKNSPDMPPYGKGHILMPHNSNARHYNEVSMRPSFAPLHDERLGSYYRQPVERLSKYERSSYPSKQDEFYRPSGAEYGLGPPSFRGGRYEYEGVSPKKFGAEYERSTLPIINFLPPSDGRSGAKRFGEHMPPPGNYGAVFPGGRGSSIERSRKRNFLTMSWCRICKIDCGTAEGLNNHSQSKDHKKIALDMIFSIKQQISMNPKLLIERAVNDVKDGSDEVHLDTTSRT